MNEEIALGIAAASFIVLVPLWAGYLSAQQQQKDRRTQKRQIVRQTLHAESEVFRLTSQALDEMDGLASKERSS